MRLLGYPKSFFRFLFYIILSNYIRSILFCWDEHRDISQTWFRVCTKVVHKVVHKNTFAKERHTLKMNECRIKKESRK